ncbi:uncharacterized protein LOC107628073 [Arachis ipaensis]|uniref:uncharacterized protein LOC107628073 n=1 Tax=Arachis ipaensis TaxID=130454 RepID=UPI0007AF7C2A|nr:uncharacterized protein LOC107628073 [Arachis ipaensis]
MDLYDGTTNPRHHLSNFKSRMYLAYASDTTRCKAFSPGIHEATTGLDVEEGQVCKLERSLYGIKQGSRQWNHMLHSVLVEAGYTKSAFDHYLFTKGTKFGFTALLVYVDDLVITGNDEKEINQIKRILDEKFKIKDIGDLKFFLGMEGTRSKKGIALYQRKYVMDLLKETRFEDCKPATTPLDYTVKLSREKEKLLKDHSGYRKLVGRLLYLVNTRPDISHAVRKLSQFLDCPTTQHMQAAHHVLKYLKGAPAIGLFFTSEVNYNLTGFSDSD